MSKPAIRKDKLHANATVRAATRTVNRLLRLAPGIEWVPLRTTTRRRVPGNALVANLRAAARSSLGSR